MMSLYKNKYRIESARLVNWNYAVEAGYFITICTKERQHFFGEVKNDEMLLNDIGQVVQSEWMKTPTVRPDMNLLLDEFVVMPNHFHCIFFIGDNQYNTQNNTPGRDAMLASPVEDSNVSSKTNDTKNKFGRQAKNVSSIMRGFKSAVTRRACHFNSDFGWQSRFHDHIIKDHDSYLRIRNYMANNPANWKSDKFFS